MKAIVLLILAGFLGGFLLSSGPARLLRFGPSTDAGKSAGDGLDLQFSLQQKGGKHGAAVQGGGGQTLSRGGAEQGGSGGGKNGKLQKAAETDQDGPPQAADAPAGDASADGEFLEGDRALAFLVGNTVKLALGKDETILRFMSPHGWQADRQNGDPSVVAHRWAWRSNHLCAFSTQGTVDCDVVRIRPEKRPKDGVGAVLGSLYLPERKIERQVLRGNAARVPELVPLIEGERLPAIGRTSGTAVRRGPDAIAAMVDRPLLVQGAPQDLRALVFGRNGDWTEVRPLVAGAKNGLDGVRLSIGHWHATDSGLCKDRSNAQPSRECFTPEQWGDATFRLTPTRPGAAQTLQVMAETK